jgi:putative inorganic carbon (HCO3(-)) transporter
MFVAILLYLVLVIIRPQDYPALVDSMPVPMLPLALILAALLWLVSARKRFDAPQYVLLLLFFVVMMLSNVANGWFGGALVQLNKFAPVVLAFIVFANAVHDRRRMVTAMAVLTLCAAVLAVHGIEQSRLGVGWTGIGMSQETRIQYVGIFNDPNDLGMLFVTCLPMAFYLASRGGVSRLLWWAAIVALVWGIVLTDSRGTLMATLGLLGVYVWWRKGLVFAGVVGALALVALMALPSRMQEMDVSEASAMGRVESWYEGLQMFRQHPLLGVGADLYSDHYRLTAHNSFVLVLAETGIIGFTLWLAFVGTCFRMMYVALRSPPEYVLAACEGGGSGGSGGVGDVDSEDEHEHQHEDQHQHQYADAADDGEVAAWFEDRAIAFTLFLALWGFFIAGFFLSRSYVVVLYLLAALVVAHYTAMRSRNGALPAFGLHHDLLRWPLLAVGGVVGLYVVVKVLLVLGA